MLSDKNIPQPPMEKVWFISSGQYAKVNRQADKHAQETNTTVTYNISEIADYMLNPASLEIQNKLVGCCIHYHPSHRSGTNHRTFLNTIVPEQFLSVFKKKPQRPETVLSDMDLEPNPIKDENLLSHIRGIYNQLKPYDPVTKALARIDERMVSDVEGVCRDDAGNLSNISLAGSLEEKILFLDTHLLQYVPLSLEKAYVGDGLFEMSGYDFLNYKPEKMYTLVRTVKNGKSEITVLSRNQKVRYKVDNIKHIFYLQLLEQLLKVNPELMTAFTMCIAGKAKPLKLFFKSQLGIDYSTAQIPRIYQEVFKKHDTDVNQIEMVVNALRDRQLGISFMYIPQTLSGKNAQETNLSVLHNLRALEAIKEAAPQVVSEISSLAAKTDVGRFYLLDKYNGVTQ